MYMKRGYIAFLQFDNGYDFVVKLNNIGRISISCQSYNISSYLGVPTKIFGR